MISSISIGDRLKIVSNDAGHGWENGTIVTSMVKQLGLGVNTHALRCKGADGRQYTVYPQDVAKGAYNLDELIAEQSKYSTMAAETESKIRYLRDSGKTELNDNEYRAYMIVKTLSSSTATDQEKMVHLVELLKEGGGI